VAVVMASPEALPEGLEPIGEAEGFSEIIFVDSAKKTG
jgi:hypothetical protein